MRTVVRFMGLACLLMSFILLVSDGTMMISDGRFYFTTLEDLMVRFGSIAMTQIQDVLSRGLHPLAGMAWKVAMNTPAMIILLAAGLSFWLMSRRQEPSLTLRLHS